MSVTAIAAHSSVPTLPADTIPPATLAWLLDEAESGPHYLALRDLCRRPPDDAELQAARAAAYAAPPLAFILDAMQPDGYWAAPGAGYLPKYTATVWALVTLAQLGASAGADARVARGCAYVLDHALCPGGQFTAGGGPSATADCLQGNLCAALLDLGCDDLRLDGAFDWLARSITGDGIAPRTDRHAERRYYAGKCGPLFRCGSNNGQPCAWGAAKALLALGKLPSTRHTPQIDAAIAQGVEFLLSVDPAGAGWPSGYAARPSGNWWKFGFPVFYVTDLLQVLEALTALGYGDDPRLAGALALARGKADAGGRWALEYDYAGKLWPRVSFGAKKQPNKWVTIRAWRVLAGRLGTEEKRR